MPAGRVMASPSNALQVSQLSALLLCCVRWCAGYALALCVPLAARAAGGADIAQLLNEVQQISVLGQPGAIIPFGTDSFPLVVGNVGGGDEGPKKVVPVVAAARLGKGRIVAFSHGGYLEKPAGDWKRLVLNAVEWAGAGRHANKPGPRRVATYGLDELVGTLRFGQHQVTHVDADTWQAALNQCDVLCIDTSFDDNPELAEAASKFVRAGGGLVTAGTGWGWASLNPGKRLTEDYLGNRVLMPAGLIVVETTPEGSGNHFAVHHPPPKLASAWEALTYLRERPTTREKANQHDTAQAGYILQAAIHALPPSDAILWPKIRELVKQSSAIPLPDKPIAAEDALQRIAVAAEDAELRRLPPEKVKAHPAASGFPFAVPADAEPITAQREIDTKVPAWHSLGLYAAPGALVTVTVPKQAAHRKLSVQIGCHTDVLWHLRTWERWPDICRRAEISMSTTRIANPFGGLVYIDVPEGCELGSILVTIAGAVESPLYVLGKTDLKDWTKHIRHLPGPWAELQCPSVVVTVPSQAIRNLDDPGPLMEFWNRGVALEDELARYRPGERTRPERFVADQQISFGYMHSGYPIECGSDMYDYNVSLAMLRGTPREPGGWGHWHELGHNHQSYDWTPSSAAEVTVNLFTMYVINKMYGVPLEMTRPDILPAEKRVPSLRAYLASARNATDWDAFEGLLMYFQLVDAFGWEKLQQVFEGYRQIESDKHPQTDEEKWDQWMIRYSWAVQKNLGPFFVKWKVPVTEKSLASIRQLPSWTHADFKKIVE